MVLSTALKKSTGRPRKGEEGKAVMSEEDVKKFAHQHEEMFFSSKPKQLVHWSNPQKENSSEIRTGFVIGISLQSKLAFGQPIHALVWIRRILETCHFSFFFFFKGTMDFFNTNNCSCLSGRYMQYKDMTKFSL